MKYFKNLSVTTKIILIIFVATWSIHLFYSNIDFSFKEIGDPDRYFSAFDFYLNHDYNTTITKGSSYLYNLINHLFFKIFDDVKKAFLFTNIISQLLVLILGILLLIKVNRKINSKSFYAVLSIYVFNILSLKAFRYSNNDVFQTVFFMLIIFLFLIAYEKKTKYHYLFFIIGIICAICTLIRPTSQIIIVVVLFSIILLEFLKKSTIFSYSKSLLLFFVPLMSIVLMCHYPSIQEKGKLGFYDKNFNEGANWLQRNYLAVKKMEAGELPVHKNSIFRETPFSEVNQYLKKNGVASLPRNQKEFLMKDPMLVLKLSIYNLGFLSLKYFRFYGFLIIFPFMYLFTKPYISMRKYPLYVFLFAMLLISTIVLTLMEFRWVIGYDILLCICILISLKYFAHTKLQPKMPYVIKTSLILVSIFNILLTFFIKSSY
ncbi:hypothetical protein CLV33_10772 [Jejuia pallidilutea]|uniref:Glycosyltransferase RgtA/B/C/D-like domain-containing protein n=1 Tax=Jejuia pallidilutea TaxID=504487 RepID=A0A362X4L8_9FLAO|nr:O-antigen polymerase [Jejuia pallidilutea]PQV47290.1 hypothetical protein CLV33_10772 [Jejuia pallidilutea]